MQRAARKQWRNSVSNVNCWAPRFDRRKFKTHQICERSAHIYHWAMMIRRAWCTKCVCKHSILTLHRKTKDYPGIGIRNTFKKLGAINFSKKIGAKFGPNCLSTCSFLFKLAEALYCPVKFLFFGSHSAHSHFRLDSAPTESFGPEATF